MRTIWFDEVVVEDISGLVKNGLCADPFGDFVVSTRIRGCGILMMYVLPACGMVVFAMVSTTVPLVPLGPGKMNGGSWARLEVI